MTLDEFIMYEPKNFKKGDIIVCVESCFNYAANEKVVNGEKYTVRDYDKGNQYVKGGVWLELTPTMKISGGSWRDYGTVRWDDDQFELYDSLVIIDIDHEEVFQLEQ